MFREVVSNLSLSPAANGQLAFYWRRLKREQLTRQLAAVMAVALVVVQLAILVAPPSAANAASTNDIIYGGIGTTSPQRTLLQVYDQNHDSIGHSGYRQLFAHFGIDRSDVADTVQGTINSSNPALWLVGRTPHSTLDEPFQVGGTTATTYYLRPLYTWGNNVSYPALIGHRHGDGAWFAVLDSSGNVVVMQPTPASASMLPTTTPNQPATSKQSTITQSTAALLFSATGRPAGNANGTTAQAGDVVEYHLTTTNSGTASVSNYVVRENINDILEYANVTDPHGGMLANGVISWPATTIKPGQSFLTTFQVTVKNPIPITPRSTSDPQSFDLRMDNVYGNAASVYLAMPPQKAIETASATLPQSGARTDSLIVFLLAAAIAYFYFRNRQLVTEIGILRGDHYGPAGNPHRRSNNSRSEGGRQ